MGHQVQLQHPTLPIPFVQLKFRERISLRDPSYFPHVSNPQLAAVNSDLIGEAWRTALSSPTCSRVSYSNVRKHRSRALGMDGGMF